MVVVQYITIILLSCLVLCVVRESKNEPQRKHENNLNKVGKKKTIGQESSKVSETTKRKQGWRKKCRVFKSRNGNLRVSKAHVWKSVLFNCIRVVRASHPRLWYHSSKRLHQGYMVRNWNRDILLRKEKNSQEWERSRELRWEPKSNGPWGAEPS